MIAAILSTGNEVLIGDIVDTNAAFIARRLTAMGIEVKKAVTVGDDLDALSRAISDLSGQVDICIATGGLGPTEDDLTSQACAKSAGQKLVLHQQAIGSMEAFFKKRGFELTLENKHQAMLPEAAGVIVNNHGTAPGFYLKIDRCLFVFLPGVPSEMKQMLDTEVKPLVAEHFRISDAITIERLTVFGLGESRVGKRLEDFINKFPELSIGYRACFPVVEVKMAATHQVSEQEQINSLLATAKSWAASRLGNNVISTQGLSMAQEVGRLLNEKCKTLAVAESCTGGLIANMMTDVSGSSDYFLFSGVTYSNDAKMNVLGVKKETIMEFGAVHEQTAREMAEGARQRSGADLAVSTTGIAGPTGGTDEKPVGMVCVGIAGQTFSSAKTYTFPYGDRLMNKQIFAATALEMLRQYLVSGKTP